MTASSARMRAGRRTPLPVALAAVVLGVPVAFVLFQTWVRQIEARMAAAAVQLSGAGATRVTSGGTIVVNGGRHVIVAILTPSCSSLGSVLALLCLAMLIPGGWRRWPAVAAAVGAIVIGNFVRITISLIAGVRLGEPGLVLFHDWVGSAFGFAYTLGGYMLMLWIVLPAHDRRPAPRAVASVAR